MVDQPATVADATCPLCRRAAALKVNKKGHLYIYCNTPGDGGCGCGVTSRYAAGDAKLAGYATKWRSAEFRERFKSGHEPPPASSPVPKPSPDPAPEPPADDPASPKVSWWDREL